MRTSESFARYLRVLILGACLAPGLGGAARGQTSPYEFLGPGLPAGHFNLYPSVSYEYNYDDNILFQSTDLPGSVPVSSGVNILRARFIADLPLSDGRVRGMYAPFYRSYTNDRFVPEDRLNHVLGVETLLFRSRPLKLAFRDDYANGTLSLQEQSARDGVPFGLGHYRVHNPRLEVGWDIGLRSGFSFIPSYSESEFSGLVSGFGTPVDYAYTTRAFEGRYNYRYSTPTTFFVYSQIERTVQSQSDLRDVQIRADTNGLGMTRTFNEVLATHVAVGYEEMTFEGGAGEDFDGLIAEGNIMWHVTDLGRMNLNLLHRPFATIYRDSNYYVATLGQLKWIQQIRSSSWMDAAATLQQNEFVPSAGVGRNERLMRLEVGAGHEFMKHLRGYAGFHIEHRESNVVQMVGGGGADPFNYQLHRFIFRIEAGWM